MTGAAVQGAAREYRVAPGRMVSVIASEAAEVAAALLQPALMGIPGPSVADAAAAAAFTHLDPAVRKVAARMGASAVPDDTPRLRCFCSGACSLSVPASAVAYRISGGAVLPGCTPAIEQLS